jgi:hypothetical protein
MENTKMENTKMENTKMENTKMENTKMENRMICINKCNFIYGIDDTNCSGCQFLCLARCHINHDVNNIQKDRRLKPEELKYSSGRWA